MLHVSTKGTLDCYAFVNFKFNGVLDFAGTVRVRGCDTFSRSKSRWGGYCVRYGSTFKLSGRNRPCGVYVAYVKGYRISHEEPMGR